MAVVALAAALSTLAVVVLAPGVDAAPSGTFLGIDVSAHNHPGGAAITWKSVRADGVRFVFVKATEGSGRASAASTNPWFKKDWDGARAAGIARGAYHFARPRYPLSTATTDARAFVAVLKASGGTGELAPALDLEVTGGLSSAALTTWTNSWLKEATRLLGRKPAIYTGRGFWTSYLDDTTTFKGHALWMANHTKASAPVALPGGWGAWSYWQYSSTGSVAGISGPVDLNRSCGYPGSTPSTAKGSRCTKTRSVTTTTAS
jgi:GH25 family lysozyme M1 (1,4-beta-N-acetylmuramidase)